jgi:hypothetical protein
MILSHRYFYWINTVRMQRLKAKSVGLPQIYHEFTQSNTGERLRTKRLLCTGEGGTPIQLIAGIKCVPMHLSMNSEVTHNSFRQSHNYVATDGQSVRLSWCHQPSRTPVHPLVLSDHCGFVDVRGPLTRRLICRSQLMLSLQTIHSRDGMLL